MRTKSEKGQSLVEFALILPLLVITVLGIAEFSILLYDKAVLTNASREGARFGIVARAPRYTADDIRPVVEAYCANHLITFGGSASVNVTASHPVQQFGYDLTVTVTYPYSFLALPRFIGIGNTLNLRAVTVMKYE